MKYTVSLYHLFFHTYSYLLYSFSQWPNKYGEPTIDLSTDTKAVIHDGDKLTNLQLKQHCVLKRLFSEYGITAPITKTLCDVLRCKLWRMGQKLSNAGAKKYTIFEDLKVELKLSGNYL